MPSWVSKVALVATALAGVLPFLGLLPHGIGTWIAIVAGVLAAFSRAATGTPLPGGVIATLIAAAGTALAAVAGFADQIPGNIENYIVAAGAALLAFAQHIPTPATPTDPKP